MDGLSSPFPGTLKIWQWRKRRYFGRFDRAIPKRKKVKAARLGGRPRPFWRVRVAPRLHLKMASPLKLWSKLKNAYVKMMLNLAGNLSSLNNGSVDVYYGKRIAKAPPPSAVAYSDEEGFESRLVFEIFKYLMASQELSATITDHSFKQQRRLLSL